MPKIREGILDVKCAGKFEQFLDLLSDKAKNQDLAELAHKAADQLRDPDFLMKLKSL
jgi:hypothetical protein